MTNKTLGSLLRSLVNKNLRDWDLKLSHVEFAYNRSPSCSTKYSPFECVYGVNPLLPFSLIDLPDNDRSNTNAHEQAENLLKIHKQVHENIVKANARYQHKANKGLKGSKQLQIGDFAWIHLRKEKFPQLRKNKLMPRAMGPFQIIDKYGDNAFKMDLPEEFGISPTST